MKSKFELTVYLIFSGILLNAQVYTIESLPIRDNYLNWDKNINMKNECGLIAWNGLEQIKGDCASNGLIGSPELDNYRPLDCKYINPPGVYNSIPTCKTTLCGVLYKDVFFADDPKRWGIIGDAFGVYEQKAKNDFDLNIPIIPNGNYLPNWSTKSMTFTNPIEGERGFEGEVQIDSTFKSRIPENLRLAARIIKDKVIGVNDFVLERILIWINEFVVQSLLIAADAIEALNQVEMIPNRGKYDFIYGHLKENKNVCIYGPLTYDKLNSPFANTHKKIEIHPAEQLWFKKSESHSSSVHVFGSFFDKSARFDKPNKNTERERWIKRENLRSFAMPFTIKLPENNRPLTNLSFYSVYLDQNRDSKNRVLSKLRSDRNLGRTTNIFSFTMNDRPLASIVVYDDGDNMDLTYRIEDVYIEREHPFILRGLLIITMPYKNIFYNLFNCVERNNIPNDDNADGISARDRYDRDSPNVYKREITYDPNSKKLSTSPGKSIKANKVYFLDLVGNAARNWEPLPDLNIYYSGPLLIQQSFNKVIFLIEPKVNIERIRIRNKITGTILTKEVE